MTNQAKFDTNNRFCIAKGPEGCPACIAPIHSVRETESFATPLESIEPIVEETIGICLITGTQIIVGDKCNVSDRMFANRSLSRLPY